MWLCVCIQHVCELNAHICMHDQKKKQAEREVSPGQSGLEVRGERKAGRVRGEGKSKEKDGFFNLLAFICPSCIGYHLCGCSQQIVQ